MNDDIENQRKLARVVKVYPAAASYVPIPGLSNPPGPQLVPDRMSTRRGKVVIECGNVSYVLPLRVSPAKRLLDDGE